MPVVVPVDEENLWIISKHNSDANIIGICVFETTCKTYLSTIKHLIAPRKDIEGRFHLHHSNKLGAALHSFMAQIGLLVLKPNIHVESYNDILSERMLSYLRGRDVTVSVPGGDLALEHGGHSSGQEPGQMTWSEEFQSGIRVSRHLIDGMDEAPKVLLKADSTWPEPDLLFEQYHLIIDMAYWARARGEREKDRGATGPVLNASLVWRKVMQEVIRGA